MNKTLDVVEDINIVLQTFDLKQYRSINKNNTISKWNNRLTLFSNNQEGIQMVFVLDWLDTESEITEDQSICILLRQILKNHFTFSTKNKIGKLLKLMLTLLLLWFLKNL